MIFGRNKRADKNEALVDFVYYMFGPDHFDCGTNKDALLSLAAVFDLISMETVAVLLDKEVSEVNKYNQYFTTAFREGLLKRYSLHPVHNRVRYIYSLTPKGLKRVTDVLLVNRSGYDYPVRSYTNNSSHIRHDYITGLCMAGLLSHNLKPAAVRTENKISPEGPGGFLSNRSMTYADGLVSIGDMCTLFFEYDAGNEPVTVGEGGRFKEYRYDLISKFGRYESNDFFNNANLLGANTKILFCFERMDDKDESLNNSDVSLLASMWGALNSIHASTYNHFKKRLSRMLDLLRDDMNKNRKILVSDFESYEGKDEARVDLKAIIPLMRDSYSNLKYSRKHYALRRSKMTSTGSEPAADDIVFVDKDFEEYGVEFMLRRLRKLRADMSEFETASSLAPGEDFPMPDNFVRFVKDRSYIKQVRFSRRRRNSITDFLCRCLLSIETDEMAVNALTLILKGASFYAMPAPLVGAYSEYIVPNDRYNVSIGRTLQAYSTASYVSMRFNHAYDADKLKNAPGAFKDMVSGGAMYEKSNDKKKEPQAFVYFENLSIDMSGFIRSVATASFLSDSDKDIHVLYVEDIEDARTFLDVLKNCSGDGYDKVIPNERMLGGYNYNYPEKFDLNKPGPLHYVFCRMPAAIPTQCLSKETLAIPEDRMFTFNRRGEIIVFAPGGERDINSKGTLYTGNFNSEEHSPTSAVLDPYVPDDDV